MNFNLSLYFQDFNSFKERFLCSSKGSRFFYSKLCKVENAEGCNFNTCIHFHYKFWSFARNNFYKFPCHLSYANAISSGCYLSSTGCYRVIQNSCMNVRYPKKQKKKSSYEIYEPLSIHHFLLTMVIAEEEKANEHQKYENGVYPKIILQGFRCGLHKSCECIPALSFHDSYSFQHCQD
ncbi:unnamed protein product [Moneuplotes crassus]|uniref:Uncharacterized protein n=1 Tax=Euplotes crassus TaxID=5936 RepID=A0AAD1XE07_EUPCR|nr:unnamed protein product [Moneuplotes crassus]